MIKKRLARYFYLAFLLIGISFVLIFLNVNNTTTSHVKAADPEPSSSVDPYPVYEKDLTVKVSFADMPFERYQYCLGAPSDRKKCYDSEFPVSGFTTTAICGDEKWTLKASEAGCVFDKDYFGLGNYTVYVTLFGKNQVEFSHTFHVYRSYPKVLPFTREGGNAFVKILEPIRPGGGDRNNYIIEGASEKGIWDECLTAPGEVELGNIKTHGPGTYVLEIWEEVNEGPTKCGGGGSHGFLYEQIWLDYNKDRSFTVLERIVDPKNEDIDPTEGGSTFPPGGFKGEDFIDTPFGQIRTDPAGFAQAFLGIALGIAGGLAFILMVFGAYRLMFAGGNPDSIQSGRQIITAAVVGLIVIIFSVFILRLIGISILQLPIPG